MAELQTKNTKHIEIDLPIVNWKAPEYDHFIRSSDWYWSLWIIAISLMVASIIFSNVLLGILILLSAFTLSVFSKRKPKIVSFKIDSKGIYAEDVLYPYSTLESFWVEETGETSAKLIVKSKRKLMPYIIIPVEGLFGDEIRYVLSQFLLEEEHHESLFVRIMEYLGF